jgi:hypothetical protein
MAAPDGDWAQRLAGAGWSLDEGTAHPGQGTRNRRLIFAANYLELVWVADGAEAAANPVRLDRRADWRTTGASPFGFGFRGELAEEDLGDYWLYEALGIPIWIHRDNEQAPERPLVFVLPAFERRGGREALRAVRLTGPAPPRLPEHAGPAFTYAPGEHRLELEVGDGAALEVTELLVLTGGAAPRP